MTRHDPIARMRHMLDHAVEAVFHNPARTAYSLKASEALAPKICLYGVPI